MSIISPYNEFRAYQGNYSSALDTGGAPSITPGGSNVMGSYVDLLTGTVTNNSYGIYIQISNIAVTSVARTMLVDIGIDRSGGTTYSVLIPYLNASNANNRGGNNMRGHCYYFPLYIQSGARIAARAQTGGSSTATFQVRVQLYSKPTHPECVRYGSWVDAIGITSTSSTGTAITPGATGAEGAWASIGSPSRRGWWVQGSQCFNNSAMNGFNYNFDVGYGDGTNKRVVIQNQRYSTATSHAGHDLPPEYMCFFTADTAGTFYARSSCESTVDTGVSAMVYVLGG